MLSSETLPEVKQEDQPSKWNTFSLFTLCTVYFLQLFLLAFQSRFNPLDLYIELQGIFELTGPMYG